MGRTLTAAVRWPEGEDGPMVITLPILIGGEAHGRQAPIPLPGELVALIAQPWLVGDRLDNAKPSDEVPTERYYGHSVAYPGGGIIYEALVAARDQHEGGKLIWSVIAGKIADATWDEIE